jgi:cytochrome c peroxidase
VEKVASSDGIVYRKVIQFFAPGKLPLPAMRVVILLCGCLGLLSVSRLIGPPGYSAGVQAAVAYFKTQAGAFAVSCTELRRAANELGDNPQAPRDRARRALAECRCRYKYIESFLEYFFRSSSTIYNRAPKFETEDGSMEYQSPVGLQVIESMLYDSIIDNRLCCNRSMR